MICTLLKSTICEVPMKRWQRRLHCLTSSDKTVPNLRRGISLHGHTQFSRENLGFLNHHIDTVPIVAQITRHALARYRRDHGEDLDFNRAYWSAPLSPSDARDLERKQIQDALGLEGTVSLTDHDTIEGVMEWQCGGDPDGLASLEWTLPYGPAYFHLGVHNLPRTQARELTARLLAYTALPDECQLGELLAMLDRIPDVLLVLNHPFWKVEAVDTISLDAILHSFLRSYGRYIHALEVSGLRPWPENQRVLELAERLRMPVVSGGDRHGWEANTMLNLTSAGSFSEFVEEIRQDGRSEIAVMPNYQEPFGLRMMQVAWDVLREYPDHPNGRRHWADRVFFEWGDGTVRPLSRCFKNGLPKELRLLTSAMAQLERQPWHTLVHAAWSLRGSSDRIPPKRQSRRSAARPALPSGEGSVA
jgi:hypothetical protein